MKITDVIIEGEGNFVGNFPQPNIGGATVKPMQVGDTVTYFGQTAKIQAQSPDRKHSRIEITKGTGGVVQTVLTSDLKRVHQGMAEGEVVPLGKKHRGDLDSVNSCSKCGGKLEGGTYMGQRIKVCQPCKQVYLPPNSGIDQQGNKIKEQGVAEDSSGLEKLHNTLWTAISEQTIDEETINEIDPGMMANLYSVFPTVAKIIVSNALNKARKEAKETSLMIDVMKKHASSQPVTPQENEAMLTQFKDIVSYGLAAVAGVLTATVAGPAAGAGVALAGAYKKELLTLLQTKGPEVLIGLLKSKGKLDVVDILSANFLGKHASQFYTAPTKPPNSGIDQQGNKIKEQGVAEEFRPTTGQAMGIRSQTARKMNPDSSKFVWKRPNQIAGSHTENELKALKFRYSAKYNSWGGTQQMWGQLEGNLKEFAPSGADRGGGNYFKTLARAWYGGAYNTGSLRRGIKSKQDVERMLQQGIVCPDGVTRKFGIDYNSTDDGVVISSDDYYEHADHGKKPNTMIDVRTGQAWGPYDYMEFKHAQLKESLTEFSPTKPPTAGAFGGNKDYGRPTSSRYIGPNKFVLGTTNNYVLTATVDKWGLEWDEDDNIWYLDSPGAVYIADATEGEIELPAPQEQRNQIHDLVSDYLNARNSAELQRVAAYYGHSADGEMATSEGIRVPAQQILGTKNRAKSAYYPTNVKPKVPKLDTPLTDKELTRLSQLAGIDTNK